MIRDRETPVGLVVLAKDDVTPALTVDSVSDLFQRPNSFPAGDDR